MKVGDKLTVRRVGREIRDPATGKVIRRVEDNLGEITITEVDEASAVGKYSGDGAGQSRRRVGITTASNGVR